MSVASKCCPTDLSYEIKEELRASCCPVATWIIPTQRMRIIQITTSVFDSNLCIGIQEFALFVWIWNLVNLCIGIDSGRFFEEDFLLSVSQVLLRIILFREDIGSIAVFSYSSESIALVELLFSYMDIFRMPQNRIPVRISPLYKIRSIIEPLLYKKCVSE